MTMYAKVKESQSGLHYSQHSAKLPVVTGLVVRIAYTDPNLIEVPDRLCERFWRGKGSSWLTHSVSFLGPQLLIM